MKSNFVFVTYFWGGHRYKAFAERWKQCCEKHKVPYQVAEMQQFSKPGMYQQGINYKPKFILSMLEKHPNKAVVYMDVDMLLHKYPTLFQNEHNVDLMCFNWNYEPAVIGNNCIDPFILETSGGLFFFNNTPQAKHILKLWYNTLNQPKYRGCADDRILAILFHNHKLINTTRVQWLPVEYFHIPQFFPNLKLNSVITHPETITSEEAAHSLGSASNRIPPDYRIQYSVRNKTKLSLNKSQEFPPLESRLKKHGFKFSNYYSLPNKTLKCTTTGIIRYPPTVDPSSLISLWLDSSKSCDVVVGNYLRKQGYDLASNAFDETTGQLKFTKEKVGLYLKRGNATFNLLQHWNAHYQKSKLKSSLKSLEYAFNSNAAHRLRLRCGNL